MISSSSPISVASSNIWRPENGFVSPSWTIASSALASPMRKPKRALGSMYGAQDIDSMPPPTPTSTSPARICASRMPTARTLEAQTLLIVSEETSLGMPALICAWREGIWPWPACRTWPMITWPTSLAADVRALERRLDRDAAELGGVERGQAAAHLADRGAGGAEDDGLGHGSSLCDRRVRVRAV